MEYGSRDSRVSEIYSPESAISLPRAIDAAAAAKELNEQQRHVLTLFDELRDRLLRYVLSFGLSSADGEEIIQEAFLSLVKHLRQGRSRHNLPGWLFRVAHNQTLKRRAGNEKRRDLNADGTMDADLHRDPAPNPEEHATMSQRQTRLLAVLNALPAQDQSCLRLRAEGLRYREIAQVLGMSLGSVAGSLSRSLEKLTRADGR
jgi:RNA polymerase sigma-70 factor, ECF subfamily